MNMEDIEIKCVLEALLEKAGHDFRHYSHTSLKRRMQQARDQAQMKYFTQMLDTLFHDEIFFDRFLKQMSVTVTEMFRDPEFYRSLREEVLPRLKTFPFVKIWHAGCATGEEVYSMAILLHEENFLDRARIYATDFNKHSLHVAEKGIYAARSVKKYAENYVAAAGKHSFAAYFSDSYDLIKMKDFLKERITFSCHKLVTDGVFGEMNLICCRNVLIYFDRDLQNRVFELFSESLRHDGFLCLGTKETLNFSSVRPLFEVVDSQQKIYKKRGEYGAGARDEARVV